MAGSTINSKISVGVTLGSVGHASPLTITSNGEIAPPAYQATALIATVSAGYALNEGSITGGPGSTPVFGPVFKGGYGVDLASGTITNSGTITGGNGAGAGSNSYAGGNGGTGIALTGGSLTNQGSIHGGSGGAGGHASSGGSGGFGGGGIDLVGGIAINDGIITGGSGGNGGVGSSGTGSRGGGGFGVYIENGTLTNDGTIIAGSAGTGGPGGGDGVGVLFKKGGTLTDAGYISGGGNNSTAVDFGSAASRLILSPSATFRGTVVAVPAYQNVLELTTGSSAGTIRLGGTIAGFDTIAFDPSADWQVSGSAAALASGEAIEGFAAGDTLVLDGFVATGDAFGTGGLVLPGSGGPRTLSIAGSFTTSDFAVTNDGTNTFVTMAHSETLNGFNYVADIYGSFAAANSLSGVVATGANSVALTADFGIDAVDSTVYDNDVAGGYTESTANVETTIGDAVNLGLQVMYRPLIDFLPSNYDTAPGQANPLNGSYGTDEFRSYYNPADVATFFASYKTMILAQAAAAEASGATLFCVGAEIDQLTGPAYKSYWTNAGGTGIIDAIRAQDPNLKLTYSADWDDDLSPWQYGGSGLAAGTGDITTQISFWNQLDYAGIDEYAPISDLADPTVSQLVDGWTQAPTDATTSAVTGGASLASYYQGVAAAVGKPLLFTEIGYANSSDADSSPATPGYDEDGNADDATADPTLQANLYTAFFQAWQQDFGGSLAGAYIWNWEPGGAGVSDFSVQGLPALTAVTDGFTACYMAGTRIATEHGEIAIEALHAGDRVRTLLNEALARIVWIGRRTIDCTRHPQPQSAWPIRIRRAAFGVGVPHRDLYLSPDHAVYADGMLIPVKYLVNGNSIAQVPMDRVTYHHVELSEHDVLLANGLPAESYLDVGDRSRFANGGYRVILHPDFASSQQEAEGCAPLIVTGPRLEAVRERLSAQAVARLKQDVSSARVG